MPEFIVYKADGSRADTVELADDTFGTVVKKALVKDYIVMYLANKRQGNAATKERSKINGSNRKPWRQKGLGRARAGSRKSPIWRGGGTVFGPQPRDFSYAMPKKARREALRSALLGKFRDREILLVDELKIEAPSTRRIADLLKALGVERSCLIVVPEPDKNVYLSTRNLQKINVLPVSDLNAYALLLHRHIVMTRAALDRLLEGFAK